MQHVWNINVYELNISFKIISHYCNYFIVTVLQKMSCNITVKFHSFQTSYLTKDNIQNRLVFIFNY